MSFQETSVDIKTIRLGDPKFMIQSGLVICPRAGFEISKSCPTEYRLIIQSCIENGWLMPVAHVYGKELTLDALR